MSGSECKSARGFAQQNRNRTKRHKRGHKKHNKESGPCFICVTNSSLLVFLARFWVKQNSPPRMRRGGCAINKKMLRSHLERRRRSGADQENYRWLNQPPRPRQQRSFRFIFVHGAATPPFPRRGVQFGCGFAALCLLWFLPFVRVRAIRAISLV